VRHKLRRHEAARLIFEQHEIFCHPRGTGYVEDVHRQNASTGSSMVDLAPASMRAKWVAVSGNMRSTKKRPVTSLAFMRSAAPSAPLANLAFAASTIRHHM